MTRKIRLTLQVLAGAGHEACYGKGGFWIAGQGFVPAATVYAQYHIASSPRQTRRIGAYGDYATIAMLNGINA